MKRPRSTWLRISYGINRRAGRRIEHRSGLLRIKGTWGEDATHRKIRALIRRRHPGWFITGYALQPAKEKGSISCMS